MDDSDGEDWSLPLEAAGGSLVVIGSKTETCLQHDTYVTSIPTQKNVQTCSSKKNRDHSRVILHIDIDCFYAQVEMIRNPALCDKPLGVQQKYIVVTCNYPARARGLSKLMLVKDALEKCPDLVLVNGEDLTNYREMSYKISNYLQQYCPLVQRLGMDENFLDITAMVSDRLQEAGNQAEVKGHVYRADLVTGDTTCHCGCHRRLTAGSRVAADIRDGLRMELGITSCAGISHNKLLAKLVAGTHKPNQQTTLLPGQVQNLMLELKNARQIPGIGSATAKRLKEMGITSVLDLQIADSSELEKEFGTVAMETMKNLSRGIDPTPVVAFGRPLSLSDEDSFKKCCSLIDARSRIRRLLLSLLERLCMDGRTPHTFRLTVRKISDWSHRESRQCSISAGVFNNFSNEKITQVCEHLETLAVGLLAKIVDTTKAFHLTLINVAFSKLEEPASNSITQFFMPKTSQNLKGISNLKPSLNLEVTNDNDGQSTASVSVDTSSTCNDSERVDMVSDHEKDCGQDIDDSSNPQVKQNSSGNVKRDDEYTHACGSVRKRSLNDWLIKSPKASCGSHSTHTDTSSHLHRSQIPDSIDTVCLRTVGDSTTYTGNVRDLKTHTGNVRDSKTHTDNVRDSKTHTGNVRDSTTHTGNVRDSTTHTGNVRDSTTHTGNVRDSTTHNAKGTTDIYIPGSDHKLSNQIHSDAQSRQKTHHSHVGKRRPIRDSNEESTDMKRIKSNECFGVNRTSTSDSVFPDDIDRDVFYELPPDIQQELLGNIQTTPKTTDKSVKDGDTDSRKTAVHKGEKREIDSEMIHSKITSSDISGATVDIRTVCTEEGEHGSQSTSNTAAAISETAQESLQTGVPPYFEDKKSHCGLEEVPPGVDKAVFLTLPSDIQQELVDEWKSKNRQKFARNTPHCKMPKPSSSNNILSYFSKK